MLKVSFIEIIIRGIPEGLLFVLSTYTFSKKIIDIKRYLISSIILAVSVYLIRLLPIQNGADFILNLSVLIALSIFVNKIDTIKAIKAVIITFLLGFICEGANIFIIQFILKKDLNDIFNNSTLKILYTSPSLLLFGGIVITYYIRLWKRKELKYV